MKVFKKIMLYLLILIALCIAAVLVSCIIMICSPKTSIFGYSYISYKEVLEEEMTLSSGVKAISITSNRTQIEILPNTESGKIKIQYSQGMSGFVKTKAKDLELKTETKSGVQFESGESGYASGTSYTTACIDVLEPNGLIFLDGCFIRVFVPTGRDFSVIYASSKNASINYTSTSDNKAIKVSNLYVDSKTKDYRKTVEINTPNASRYYIKTVSGQCYFNNGDKDIGGKIIFESAGGKLIAKSGTLNADLIVRSSAAVNGATLDITKLDGNLTFNAKSGNIGIGEVVNSIVDIQSEYCNIEINQLIGSITVQGYNGKDVDNIDVNIKTLIYQEATNRNIDIDSGKGNIVINTLKGAANLTSSTGNITVTKAYNDISIMTNNGGINLAFSETECNLANLTINVARKSNMNLKGVQGNVTINCCLLATGGERKITITPSQKVKLGASCRIMISSENDKIYLNNIGGDTKLAVYSDGPIGGSAPGLTINSSDRDYDDGFSKPNQERFNYSKGGYPNCELFVSNSGTSSRDACVTYVNF